MSLKVVHQSVPTVTWRSRIEGAVDEREIVVIVRDYLAQVDRFEITQLPEECRPGKFFTAEDVMVYTYALVRHQCKDEPGLGEFALKLAAFFSQASFRLTQVMAHTNDDQPDSRQSA